MISVSGCRLLTGLLLSAVLSVVCVFSETSTISTVTVRESEGRLFVHTRPMGARVYLDGVEQPGRTPMIIESPAAGTRQLTVRMSGFAAEESVIEAGPGIVTAVEYNLTSAGVIVVPPGADGAEAVSLDSGRYDLGLKEDIESLLPVYPRQQWIDGLNIAIPVVTALAGGILLAETLAPQSDRRYSPYTIALLATDIVMIGANAGLHIDRANWRTDWIADPVSGAPAWAEEDFDAAMSAFNSGLLAEAGLLFDRFALRFPLDERSPEAIYFSARVSFLTGDPVTAGNRLELMERQYPVPALWGRSRELYAEVLFRSGRTEPGLSMLEEIYGFDESVDRESVDLTRTRIIAGEAMEDGDAAVAAAAWNELIAAWPDSVLVDEYERIRDSLAPKDNPDQVSAEILESSGPLSP